MNKAVQNKMNRIISKDYSSARIREGEEWYIGHGIFMDRQDTKEHLLDQMDIMKDIVKSVASLQSSIETRIRMYSCSFMEHRHLGPFLRLRRSSLHLALHVKQIAGEMMNE